MVSQTSSFNLIHKLLVKYEETGIVVRRDVPGRPSKVAEAVSQLVEGQMRAGDETTAKELQKILADNGHFVSLRTVLHCCSLLDWMYCGSSYCQLI